MRGPKPRINDFEPQLSEGTSSMSARQSGPRRILGELLVITASILLAFALEAWWSARAEQRRFDEVMLAVRSEFAGAHAELARAREIHEGTVQALEDLISLMGPDPDAAAMDGLSRHWAEARFTSTDVPQGVLSNLLASGDISALPDVGLRARLSAWPAAVEDHIATELMYADALEASRELVSQRTPIPPGWGAQDYTTAFPMQPRAVLTDFAVENSLARTLLLLRIVVGENDALSRDADGILEALDTLLANR